MLEELKKILNYVIDRIKVYFLPVIVLILGMVLYANIFYYSTVEEFNWDELTHIFKPNYEAYVNDIEFDFIMY